MITAHEVHDADFRRAAVGKAGYDEVAVDDFLDRVIETLTALDHGTALPAHPVTSAEVVDVEFPERSANVHGGYDLDDVDDLLDEVAKRLFAHERRSGGGHAPGGAATGGPASGGEPLPDDARSDGQDSVENGGAAAPSAPELSDDGLVGQSGFAGVDDDRGYAGMDRDGMDREGRGSDGGVADAAALAAAAGAPAVSQHVSSERGGSERSGDRSGRDVQAGAGVEGGGVEGGDGAGVSGGDSDGDATRGPRIVAVGPVVEGGGDDVAGSDGRESDAQVAHGQQSDARQLGGDEPVARELDGRTSGESLLGGSRPDNHGPAVTELGSEPSDPEARVLVSDPSASASQNVTGMPVSQVRSAESDAEQGRDPELPGASHGAAIGAHVGAGEVGAGEDAVSTTGLEDAAVDGANNIGAGIDPVNADGMSARRMDHGAAGTRGRDDALAAGQNGGANRAADQDEHSVSDHQVNMVGGEPLSEDPETHHVKEASEEPIHPVGSDPESFEDHEGQRHEGQNLDGGLDGDERSAAEGTAPSTPPSSPGSPSVASVPTEHSGAVEPTGHSADSADAPVVDDIVAGQTFAGADAGADRDQNADADRAQNFGAAQNASGDAPVTSTSAAGADAPGHGDTQGGTPNIENGSGIEAQAIPVSSADLSDATQGDGHDGEHRSGPEAPAIPTSAASVIVNDAANGGGQDAGATPRRTMGETWGDGVGAEAPLPGVAGHERVVTNSGSATTGGTSTAQGSQGADAPANGTPTNGAVGAGEQNVSPSPVSQSDWAPSQEPESSPQFVSYPATDHRVPLPRAEIRRSMSDADREAEAQYHPEYSAYANRDDERPADDLALPAAFLPDLETHETGSADSQQVFGDTPAASFSTPSEPVPSDQSAPTPAAQENLMADDSTHSVPQDAAHAGDPASAGDAHLAGDADLDGMIDAATPGRVAPANEEVARERAPRDPSTVGNPPPPVAAELARQAASRDAERRDTPVGEAPQGDVPVEAAPAGEMSQGHAPAGEVRQGHVAVDTPPARDTTFGGVPASTAPVGEDRVNGTPVNDTTVAGTPAQGAPTVAPSSMLESATGIERPAPIDAPTSLDELKEPDPIDAPKALPKRDDTSRKGILRRIFKG